ncbi:coiled-coil domain-containing protein 175 [Rhinophrynus dorsalis]
MNNQVEKDLRSEDPAFDVEALEHLKAIADAVKELEEVRRTTREHLEMETIETSKLRYTVQHLPATIAKEIEEAVLSARDSNALEMETLQNELRNKTLELELAGQKQMELEERNSFLSQQGEALWGEYQQSVDLLNQQMAEKAHLNIVLNETHIKCKEAQDAAIEYKNRTEDLIEDMIIERQLFVEEKEVLTNEILETKKKTEIQEEQNMKKKEIFDRLTSELFDVEEKIDREKTIVIGVEDNILLLKASHARLTEKLDIQKMETTDLFKRKGDLELCIAKMKEDFNKESSSLNEKILKLEEQVNSAEILHQTLIDTNKQLKQDFKSAREEEDEEFVLKQDLAKQLEKSRADLDEKMEFCGKLKKEMREMEAEIGRLMESSRHHTEQNAAHVEESKENLSKERQKRTSLQVRKDEVLKERELWKLSEETFTNQMKEKIANGQKQIASLMEEGDSLQRDIAEWDKQIKSLNEEQVKANEAYSDLEKSLTKQIEALQEELNAVNGNLLEENEKLAANLPILNDAQEKYNTENHKYEELKKQAGELKNHQKSVELSIQRITRDIKINSDIKEAKALALKELRGALYKELQHYLERLQEIEKDVYEENRRLELVVMENCRLKLCCLQLKEDIEKSVDEENKHTLAIKHMESDLASQIGEDFSEQDQEILDAIVELIKKINHRAEKMGHLNSKLEDKFNGLASLLDSKANQQWETCGSSAATGLHSHQL